MQDRDTELKPCPFCGGKAESLESTFCVWKVFCTECGAKMEITTDADADVLWNKRVPPTTKQIEEYIEKTHKENMELVAKLKRKYEVEP